jgi:hypothetical protein
MGTIYFRNSTNSDSVKGEKSIILSIPRTVDKQFPPFKQNDAQCCSYLYGNITLNSPTYFDPQGIIIREPNQTEAVLHKAKLATSIHISHGVNESKT